MTEGARVSTSDSFPERFGSDSTDPERRHSLVSVPMLPNLSLSDDEKATFDRLYERMQVRRAHMLISEAYYRSEQVVKNLRIAVPKELEFLSTVVGWPKLAVDPYVEKLHPDCFRLVDSTDADADLMDLWRANGLDAEFPLAVKDALTLGRAYWMIGSPEESGGAPVITVESPLHMAVEWSPNGKTALNGLQEYHADGRQRMALYLNGKTIQLAARDEGADAGKWEVVSSDPHGFMPPIVRMVHNAYTGNREGESAITTAIRSNTDSACRTLLNLEIARELFSVRKELWLGAIAAQFQNSDGSTQSIVDAYMTRIKMIERDDDGELPEVKQLEAYDPSNFTRLIEMYAAQAASQLYATPQELGLYTQGNPVSPDTVDAQQARRNDRARLYQKMMGVDLARVLQWGIRFEKGGALPPEFRSMFTDWTDVENPSLSVRGDFVQKMVIAKVIPPTSDVTLSRAGFSAIERARLAQDRDEAAGEQFQADILDRLKPQAGGDATAAQ